MAFLVVMPVLNLMLISCFKTCKFNFGLSLLSTFPPVLPLSGKCISFDVYPCCVPSLLFYPFQANAFHLMFIPVVYLPSCFTPFRQMHFIWCSQCHVSLLKKYNTNYLWILTWAINQVISFILSQIQITIQIIQLCVVPVILSYSGTFQPWRGVHWFHRLLTMDNFALLI